MHKWANLKEACPRHARPELRQDWRNVAYAKDGKAALKAYNAMVTKWADLCPSVGRSLEDGGTDLLSFYRFPKQLWRSLRTTNSIENLNREFRRRTKTQGSFSTEDAALTLLFALVAFGQITMRKIDGAAHIPALLEQPALMNDVA